MTSKDLLDRMILLEKLIELKSNECAYYRTKVHLMQLNVSKDIQRGSSSEEEEEQQHFSPIKSISDSSIPFRISKRRDRNTAQNQNSHCAQDKNIQCNEKDFHSMEMPQTILKIRLPHRFIKSLLARPRKSSAPRLKVHLSSQLLNKLFHSNSSTGQFTIRSQFGKFPACIDQKQQTKAIHAKAEMKIHSMDRLAIVRHIVRTRSDGSDRQKVLIDKSDHYHQNNSSKYRETKRDLPQSSSTSHEQSKRSSMTNLSRTTETLSSTDQTSNSIRIENTEEKKRKINIKR